MAPSQVHRREDDLFCFFLEPPKGDRAKSERMSFEKKIEFLESLTGKEEALDLSTTWKRSRAWIKKIWCIWL